MHTKRVEMHHSPLPVTSNPYADSICSTLSPLSAFFHQIQ